MPISTEEIRSIARSEAVAVGNEAQRECTERGPVCTIWREIGTMRAELGTIKIEQAKLLAVLGFWKWALPVVVAIVAAAAGILAPRIWPAPAQAAPVVQVQR